MIRTLSILTLVPFILGACDHYSEKLAQLEHDVSIQPATEIAYDPNSLNDIASAAGGEAGMIAHDSFSTALAREYTALAKYENEMSMDYKSAKVYTDKAFGALQGREIEPFNPLLFSVHDDVLPEMQKAREMLLQAKKTQIAPQNAVSLAKAQASYDCWVEQQSENHEPDQINQCHQNFEQAMASLALVPVGEPTVYPVFFASGIITPDQGAQAILDSVVTRALADPAQGYDVLIQAAADDIAQSRVLALRQFLTTKGIPAQSIMQEIHPALSNEQVNVVLKPKAPLNAQPI